MPAVLEAPVHARQRLSVDQLRAEALALYAEARKRGVTQVALSGQIGTTQSAISAAVNAAPEEASTHAAVYVRLINGLSDRYLVVKEERVEFRVERKAE
ncbi:MAG TPA: hypothetical protein VD838_01410 [Anaeromyxobacteraceae bacterium]|nr:hypothetical protein [Anaeromyxobacteraceae bacterium]